MATKREKAMTLIQKAGDSEIEVTALDENTTIIKVALPKEKVQKKGKWARVAEEMARENLLDGGRGDRLRNSIREFREDFAFRDVFSEDKTG